MQKEVHTQDEIDLMELLARFYAALKKNIVLAILLPLAGLIIAFVITRIPSVRIVSRMLVETDLLSRQEGDFLMKQLETADTLPGLEPSLRMKILKVSHEIESSEPPRSSDQFDGIEKPIVYITIVATVNDRNVLPELQKAIVSYLNLSEPFVKERNNRKKFLTELLSKIDTELESLQQFKTETANVTKGSYINPSDLFAKSVDLYGKKVRYELRLKSNLDVRIVQGLTSASMDARISKKYALALGFFVGLILLLIIMFIKFFNNYYRQHYKAG